MKELLFVAGAGMAGTEARHSDCGADSQARQPNDGEKKHRPMLRNANIDYSHGTFFVTIQAAFNKTIFGAIVGDRNVLNELGKAVEESLRSLGERYPGTEVIEFVVMPNHIHVILRIARRRDNRKHQLGYVIGRFKGWIAKVYRDMLADGRAVDVGSTPWQRDYWDKLVTTDEQLEAYRRYIRQNPAKWARDRFGAVTSHSFGEIGLLNARLVGFVASQGAFTSELKPRLLWRKGAGTEARPPDQIAGTEARQLSTEACQPSTEERLFPVISTFTSAQERAVLGKLLARGRRFVRIYPGGIPPKEELESAVAAACEAGRALLISPVPPGTDINKQRAVWCNEYVLKNSAEVWAGAITPGHTLDSLVKALRPKGSGAEASQA
ncbi:MAG: transposase [Kiritimatiellae bacterium]|nr:transposase [Kiritimatiellia bacterium]